MLQVSELWRERIEAANSLNEVIHTDGNWARDSYPANNPGPMKATDEY